MGVAFESGRWWEVATGSIESLAVALSLAVFATGCGKIAGLDEYSVFGGCPPGSVSEAPAQCVKVPSCGLDEVPTTGGCVRAGVPADGCGHGFEPDPERPGGCREIFPDCAEASLALLGATTCNWGTCGVLAAGAEGLFVKADAVAGGSGTRESPVRTIEEALVKARETPAAAPAIWLFPGSYAGPLVFDQPTRLYGFCLPDTIITSADASSAVIEIGPDADGSNVAGVTLRGESATAGIRVDGAEDVTLGSVVGSFPVPGSLLIDTVGGPGVLFEDMSAATSGKLDGVAIRAAMGAGVAAYGVTKLELENVRVVDTRPREADGRAVGVLVAPSVSVSVAAAAGQVNYDEVSARRSTVSISLSRIDGAAGAGIFVEGSDVTIDGTSIRRVVPDGFGRSAGLAVQRRWLGARPATLQLTRSVISDVAGSGVRLDDVDSALVEDTTIHDVESLGPGAGDAPAEPGGALGGCSGNGVRVRAFGTALSGADAGTPERGPAILERVLIQDTRESAVHVEGATAILRQSLIRDVGGCSASLGDGIAAYGYSLAPA